MPKNISDVVARLRALRQRLATRAQTINDASGGKISAEEVELIELAGEINDRAQDLDFLNDSIDTIEKGIAEGNEAAMSETNRKRLERDIKAAQSKLSASQKWEKRGNELLQKIPIPSQAPKPTPKPDPQAREFQAVYKKIDSSVDKINKKIPHIQKQSLDQILEDLTRLELNNGKIKSTVRNLSIIASIKNKLQRAILSDDYMNEVKEFTKSFNDLTKQQNDLWKAAEKEFNTRPLLREIRKQSIGDTVNKLTEAGIGANIADPIAEILRQNITGGGSYSKLADQLREFMTRAGGTPGSLERYVKQITTDSINQYNAQYTQVVSSDLGFEWFKYDNSDIATTRPFCDAMTDIEFFHISDVPQILRAEGLTYINKKGERVSVPIYEKTGLPHGMIPGTDVSNFFVRRGGYNCGHQIRPVSEALIKQMRPKFLDQRASKIGIEIRKDGDTPGKMASKAMDRKVDSYNLHREEDGTFTSERGKLHRELIAGELSHGSTKTGTAYMLGGAPANGKSTVIESGVLPHPKGILKIDADEFKKGLPEYNALVKNGDFRAAAFAHEESSFLAKEMTKAALKLDYDTLADGVADGKFEDIVKKVNQYQAAGKRVRIDYTTLDTDLSLKLAQQRAVRTGREVPKTYILEMNKAIAELVPKLAKEKIFDELYLWDTNEKTAPRLILTSIDGKTKIHDQALYNRFLKKAK